MLYYLLICTVSLLLTVVNTTSAQDLPTTVTLMAPAGILGTVLGIKAIPQKWAVLKNLPVDNISIRKYIPRP
jgi:xanthosine utilization system XapX-like protein